MRLHLVIQRHGLPVTRILWTTAPPSLFGQNAPSTPTVVPATSSAITSTRTPNALYANGGYTIAQLLEDVNGVIPLETEPALFDSECSGQWGLEDYVVEVAGSECLHFMEVEGLLRDGDEVLIRALQLADLHARRLSGRHQISADGRHLIDGVPFGKPFLKRPTSSRPAITIPPRKKRRTSVVSWGDRPAGYEDEDTEWAPGRIRSLKELSALREGSGSEDKPDDDEYEDAFQDDYEDFHQVHEDTGDGTVIRYNVDQNEETQASESDADISDFEDGDLTEELKELKEDIDTSAMPQTEKADDEQAERSGYSLRTRSSLHQAPRPSILQNAGKKLPDADASRRDSKAVRFEGQKEPSPAPAPSVPAQASPGTQEPEEDTVAADKAGNDSSSSSSSSSASDVSSDASSDSENSSSSSDSSDSDSESSSSDSDDSASDSELEDVSSISTSKTRPPGLGSQRTKKSNQRNKMRRRLAKLKELGALPAEADFAALRDLEEKHGGSYRFPETTPSTKVNEQTEFEAKRQKLLRDLESGGIDVTEKENVPPSDKENNNEVPVSEKENTVSTAENANEASAESKRRTLDVASSRRLLFGSLGVRTPRTKEDEEATRKKLAGKVKNNLCQKQATEETPTEQVESDSEENWQDKLLIRATECIFDDVELTAPPFPFEQRWDAEAGDIIRQRKGWGRKRKRKQRIQVYDGQDEEEEYYGNGGYWDEDEEGLQLNYDDTEQPYHNMEGVEQTGQEDAPEETEKDLPDIPDDLASLGDLVEDDLKKGTVIAFKQLDMSKATNWQPTVSEYRVAEIHDVLEDETLKLRLAKRDRRQPKMTEDDEDEPQYSGFEMPGFDDDDAEDDGFREVSFSDLIDSKLLRAATVTGAPEKVSFSPQEPPKRSPTPDAKADEKAPPKDQQLIQKDPDTLTKDVVDAARASGEDSSFGVRSPEFHGFQSSDEEMGSASPGSPAHRHQANHEDNKDHANYADECDNEGPNSGVRLSEPSIPPSSVPQNRSNEAPPQPTRWDFDLEMISSPETPESFNRLIASLFDKVGIEKSRSPGPKAEKTAEQRPETELNGEKEQVQGREGKDQKPARPTSRSSACSVVPNPFYEIDRAYEEQQRCNSRKTQKSLGAEEGDTTVNYLSAMEYASSPVERQSPTADRQPSPSQPEASLISVVPETLLEDRTAAQEDNLPPPDSQMEPSQVIDLTQSSPLVSPDGSDEDFARSNRLPRGPGWVQKNIPKTRRLTRHSLGRGQRLLDSGSISPPATRRRRGKTRGWKQGSD